MTAVALLRHHTDRVVFVASKRSALAPLSESRSDAASEQVNL